MGIRVSARVSLQMRKRASVRACACDCVRSSESECVRLCTVSVCKCDCVRKSVRECMKSC